jgi:hypothetical protein
MDWRIQKTIDNLLSYVKQATADRISIPGGAGKNMDLVEKWVGMSCKLHVPSSIILTVHEDCGAGATKDDLIDIFKRVATQYTNKEVRAFYINLDGTWSEIKS